MRGNLAAAAGGLASTPFVSSATPAAEIGCLPGLPAS
jgi:hypothetical protein